jgi:hypothetical protein
MRKFPHLLNPTPQKHFMWIADTFVWFRLIRGGKA